MTERLNQWVEHARLLWQHNSKAAGSLEPSHEDCNRVCVELIRQALSDWKRASPQGDFFSYSGSLDATTRSRRRLEEVERHLRSLLNLNFASYASLMEISNPSSADVENAFDVRQAPPTPSTPIEDSGSQLVCTLLHVLSLLRTAEFPASLQQPNLSQCQVDASATVGDIYARCLHWTFARLSTEATDARYLGRSLNEKLATGNQHEIETRLASALTSKKFAEDLQILHIRQTSQTETQNIQEENQATKNAMQPIVLDLLALVHLKCCRYMSVKVADLEATSKDTIARQVFASQAAQVARGHVQPLHHFIENALSKFHRSSPS